MYFVKTPWWLRKAYSSAFTWKMPAHNNQIFLTFDDGPHPTVTPFVLNCLRQYNAKATFFCLGKNVKQYPNVYHKILNEGHRVANHTNNHLNGWKTKNQEYFDNVILAQNYISSNLFRPPYGRITKSQAELLTPAFKIIMWDVLSGDFDIKLSPEKCLQNVVSNTIIPGQVQ